MRSSTWAFLALTAIGLSGCGGDNPPAGSISLQGTSKGGEAAAPAAGDVPAVPEAIKRGGRGID